jgi:RNA methyltransferase, TrmH family
MKSISSRQNPIVRAFRSLAETPDPDGARVLLDGAHLVRDARAAGTALEIVVVEESRLQSETEEGILAQMLARDGIEVVQAQDKVFATLSPVKTPSGIAAIGRRRSTAVEEICAPDVAFVLAAVNVQDPGNVGSLLRVAEAGGVTGAFVCGTSANPYAWKALRGSMGSALRLPIVTGLTQEAAFTAMKRSGLRLVAAVPRNGRDPDAIDWSGRVGLLLGGEGLGLADEIIAACDERVSIGMAEPVESLNVAAAGAVLIYTARRQRLAASVIPS